MKVRAFYTTGNNDIKEYRYQKPDLADDEIEVKTIYTGICSSDVAMYTGKFQLLPREKQGHEGLGVVTQVGKGITDVFIGMCVATRGEPAFADFYNAKVGTFVVVPEAHTRYIIEPIACAINIAWKLKPGDIEKPILMLGTGCLAMVVHRYLSIENKHLNMTVVGAANKEYWEKRVTLISESEFKENPTQFDTVIDMSDKVDYLSLPIFNDDAHLILGGEKSQPLLTTFSDFLRKGIKITCASPCNTGFYEAMKLAVKLISNEKLYVDDLWTHGYSRARVMNAFKKTASRPGLFKRSYLIWRDKK